jgi:myo-inositol-1(or 4)-monophosphatase
MLPAVGFVLCGAGPDTLRCRPRRERRRLTEMLEVAAAAARAGGAALRETLGARREINWKTDSDGERSVVTDADLRADAAIQAVIRSAAPGHAILSEEGGAPERIDEHLWVIDPLDGTDEFSRGSPSCCVAVAYLRDGRPAASAVYDPFRDELFSAARGRGAWLNGRPIRVSGIERLADAVVAISSPDRRRSEEAFQLTKAILDDLLDTTRLVRVYGSTAMEICWIGCGRLEAKVSLRGRAWDFFAAALVLEEAGGVCRELTGGPLTLDTVGALASNGPFHADLTRLVGRRLGADAGD